MLLSAFETLDPCAEGCVGSLQFLDLPPQRGHLLVQLGSVKRLVAVGFRHAAYPTLGTLRMHLDTR